MAENEFEHLVKMLPIDENLPAAVEVLKTEGWELIPNIPPVAVYHIVRLKNRSKDMKLQMTIDESKIGILRNGKMVEQ